MRKIAVMKTFRRCGFILILMGFFHSGGIISKEPQNGHPPRPVEVVVDGKRSIAVKNMIGYLGVISTEGFPEMVQIFKAVQPYLLRGELADAVALRDFARRHHEEESRGMKAIYRTFDEGGGRYIVLLSNFWGYPEWGWHMPGPRGMLKGPGVKGPPYENWSQWERLVVRVVANVLKELPPERVIFEVWNEPAVKNIFWEGDDALFYETYQRAERAIHSVYPEARVAGPCFAGIFNMDRLRKFLDDCLHHKARVDVLTYHQLQIRPKPWWKKHGEQITKRIEKQVGDVRVIAENLKAVRREFVANPRYAPLGIKEVIISEYMDRYDRYAPGDNVGYFWALEAGGADGAVRSCWKPHPRAGYRESDCGNNTLDGLLKGKDPRPVYWVYRAYRAGVKSRVFSQSRDPRILTLASRKSFGGKGVAQCLIGYQSLKGAVKERLRIRVVFKNLTESRKGRALYYTVMKVPYREDAVLKSPEVTRTGRVARSDKGEIVINAGVLAARDAMFVVVHRTPSFSLRGDFPYPAGRTRE